MNPPKLIETFITPEMRPELDRLVADQSVSVDFLTAYFRKQGLKFCRSSVWRWRNRHRTLLTDPAEQLRQYIHGRLDGMNFTQLTDVCERVNRTKT